MFQEREIKQNGVAGPCSGLNVSVASMRRLVSGVLFAVLCSCTPGILGQNGLPVHSFEKEITRRVQAKYLLFLPKDYSKANKKWPVILYLHGGMGRGDDIQKILWYPLPRMLDRAESFPFIVVIPQCPEGQMWSDTELLIALLDEVSAKYPVDSTRVYLMGYSMGGYGAWNLAYEYPNRFAAVAPMSGRANPWWATRLKDVPIWAFHGAKDETVPVSETLGMIEALHAEGGNPKVSIDAQRGHRPPTDEEHKAVFAWFLEHQKDATKQARK